LAGFQAEALQISFKPARSLGAFSAISRISAHAGETQKLKQCVATALEISVNQVQDGLKFLHDLNESIRVLNSLAQLRAKRQNGLI
jgi:hypothetical protein